MKRTPPDPGRLALHSATVQGRWRLREAMEGCARHGLRGFALRREELAALGAKEAARLARDLGLTVTSLHHAAGFPASDRRGRQAALDEALRAVEQAAELGARCLALVVGGLPPGSKDLAGAREMARDGVGEVLERARPAGVPLAIEPLHPLHCADRSSVTTLAQALDLCDELDRDGQALGVVVDAWHVWWDPALSVQIERAGGRRLLAFQLADWPARADGAPERAMMGDGVIDLALIRSWMEAADYRGFHEVELHPSHEWSARSPEDVIGAMKRRHEDCC